MPTPAPSSDGRCAIGRMPTRLSGVWSVNTIIRCMVSSGTVDCPVRTLADTIDNTVGKRPSPEREVSRKSWPTGQRKRSSPPLLIEDCDVSTRSGLTLPKMSRHVFRNRGRQSRNILEKPILLVARTSFARAFLGRGRKILKLGKSDFLCGSAQSRMIPNIEANNVRFRRPSKDKWAARATLR